MKLRTSTPPRTTTPFEKELEARWAEARERAPRPRPHRAPLLPDHVFLHTTARRIAPGWWLWTVKGLQGHALTERGAYRRAARAYARRAEQ